MRLWISARYATELSSVICLCTRMEASITHDPELLSQPNSLHVASCSLLPISALFTSLNLSPPAPFPLPCSILPFSSTLITPNSSSPSPHSSFHYLSLLFPSQSTARGWASATSMKTDDSVLFFSLPTAADPPPGEVCLPRRRGGNEKD